LVGVCDKNEGGVFKVEPVTVDDRDDAFRRAGCISCRCSCISEERRFVVKVSFVAEVEPTGSVVAADAGFGEELVK
jgi:hypothetical protein